jgi:hypothetical protein
MPNPRGVNQYTKGTRTKKVAVKQLGRKLGKKKR